MYLVACQGAGRYKCTPGQCARPWFLRVNSPACGWNYYIIGTAFWRIFASHQVCPRRTSIAHKADHSIDCIGTGATHQVIRRRLPSPTTPQDRHSFTPIFVPPARIRTGLEPQQQAPIQTKAGKHSRQLNPVTRHPRGPHANHAPVK